MNMWQWLLVAVVLFGLPGGGGAAIAPEEGFLGISVKPSNDALVVVGVVKGSPAESGGVREGDILLSIDGKNIATIDEFKSALKGRGPGSKVSIGLHRGEESFDKEIVLGERIKPAPVPAPASGEGVGKAMAMFEKSEKDIRAEIAKLPESEAKRWREAIAVAERSTVRIVVPLEGTGIRGNIDLKASGFLIDGGNYLVTAGHAYHQIQSNFAQMRIKPPERIGFVLPNGKRYFAIVLKWKFDVKTQFGVYEDITIAEVVNPNNDPLPSVELAEGVTKSERVIIAGFPLEVGKTKEGKMATPRASPNDLTAVLCVGGVSKTSEKLLWADLSSGTCLLPGNSGGPILNPDGKIVGIATYSGNGWGGGTLVNVIRQYLDGVKAKGEKKQGAFGAPFKKAA